MKYLLLLIAVGVAVWLLRRGLQRLSGRPARGSEVAPAEHEAIVACAHCGLMLPAGEALPGRGGGVFCSEAHRLAADAGQPPAG